MVKSDGNGNGRSTSKTTKQKYTWPATVSFLGKEVPKSGIVLKFYCLGMTDGVPDVLETKDVPVTLDEKGKFKTDLSSPTVTLTKTKKQNNNRNGGGGGGGSSVSGQSVSGCIVQLVVADKVERVFASKPAWAKLAKQNPIPSEDLGKLR